MTWPVAPLLDLPGVDTRRVCRVLHISGSTYRQIVERGMSTWQADRAAIRLGVMPWDVWPEWIDAGLGPLDHDYLASGWRRAWLWQETA